MGSPTLPEKTKDKRPAAACLFVSEIFSLPADCPPILL